MRATSHHLGLASPIDRPTVPWGCRPHTWLVSVWRSLCRPHIVYPESKTQGGAHDGPVSSLHITTAGAPFLQCIMPFSVTSLAKTACLEQMVMPWPFHATKPSMGHEPSSAHPLQQSPPTHTPRIPLPACETPRPHSRPQPVSRLGRAAPPRPFPLAPGEKKGGSQHRHP